MSEWDFLWGLKGQALQDAMASGIEFDHWDYITVDNVELDDSDEENAFINEQHRLALKEEWDHLKLLRDNNSITIEEFRRRKFALFPVRKR